LAVVIVKSREDAVEERLDAVFAALADPTRRGILETLSQGGDLAVSELAAPHDMSLPGFMKHLRVLENAGLVARSKEGRVVSCELSAAPMKAASVWMSRYEKFWTEKLDSLARYLYQQEELHPSWKDRNFRKDPNSRNRPGSGKNPSSPSSAASPSGRKRSGARGPTRKR
jgi:DNA-binding transcriptional ArsR family regulator